MGKVNLYTIGTQSRTLKQWKQIFGDTIPPEPTIKSRISRAGMTFFEAITYVKPDPIYVGEIYNEIEVLEVPIKKSKANCKARCYCGKEFWISIYSLKTGHTKSCGCYRKEIQGTQNKTHGLSKHILYSPWKSMNERCNNPKDSCFHLYGGAGVTVCPEWHQNNPNGIKNFIRDMYTNYKEGYQLDKDIRAIPGQPKVYSKDTTCWVSPTDNSRASSNTKLTVDQVKEIKQRLSLGHLQKDIAKDFNVAPGTVSSIKTSKTWRDIN